MKNKMGRNVLGLSLIVGAIVLTVGTIICQANSLSDRQLASIYGGGNCGCKDGGGNCSTTGTGSCSSVSGACGVNCTGNDANNSASNGCNNPSGGSTACHTDTRGCAGQPTHCTIDNNGNWNCTNSGSGDGGICGSYTKCVT